MNQPNASGKKAKIERMAVVCVGALFAVLLVRTLVTREQAPPPVTRATAEPRAPDLRLCPSSASTRWERETDRGSVREDETADSVRCVLPPNPFVLSESLRREIRGAGHRARAPSHEPPAKRRIEVKLEGIVTDHSSGERIALIDGVLLRVGDHDRGFTVVEIEPSRVVLDGGGERRVLVLEKP